MTHVEMVLSFFIAFATAVFAISAERTPPSTASSLLDESIATEGRARYHGDVNASGMFMEKHAQLESTAMVRRHVSRAHLHHRSAIMLAAGTAGNGDHEGAPEVIEAVENLTENVEKEVKKDIAPKLEKPKDGPTFVWGEVSGAIMCAGIVLCVIFVYFKEWMDARALQGQASSQKLAEQAGAAPGGKVQKLAHTMSPEVLESELAGTQLRGLAFASLPGSFGLAQDQVSKQLAIFGENKITPPVKPSQLWLLMKQVFGGVFNSLLWFCVVVEIALASFMGADQSDLVTPGILSFVIAMAGFLQWWTEMQAESMMNSLQQMQGVENVTTYRAGKELSMPTQDLVPGDVVVLEAGMRVPADIRILDATDGALVDTSALTGESVPEARRKETVTVPEGEQAAPIIESSNMLFSGTSVVQGRLLGVVFGTGDRTLLGQIALGVQKPRPRSSLEHQIEHFVHLIAITATCTGLLSLVANLLSPQKLSIEKVLLNSSTAFFTFVPEGLMPTVTFSLMISSWKMASRQVLIRRIDAVETLGCVNVLCSDKTGTLTSGMMTVTELAVMEASGELKARSLQEAVEAGASESSVLCRLVEGGLLNSTAKAGRDGQLTGSPTEVAIVSACQKVKAKSVSEALSSEPQIFDIPFSSTSKWMLTAHSTAKGPIRLVLKGAPERIMERCELTQEQAADVTKCYEQFMASGKRVVMFAEYEFTTSKDFAFKGSSFEDANFPTNGYTFSGVVAIEDPPKEGVVESIARMRSAGCMTVMVTGDHPNTAQAIAKRIGIIRDDLDSESDGPFRAVTGAMIESNGSPPSNLTLEDVASRPSVAPECADFWKSCVMHARVYARVSPLNKQGIVQAYKLFAGHIVAMTGDGVNDAPALKEADVGISMGIRGTEVAKEAADVVLLDDDLRSVAAGMEQGRLCAENLRKSILYTMCSKVPQALPTFFQLAGVPIALTTVQVLLIDIGTDIWTAIAYAAQPPESSLMEREPRHPRKDSIVNKGMLLYSFAYIGVLQSIFCWLAFFNMPGMIALASKTQVPVVYTHEEKVSLQAGTTMYYWALVCGQVGAAYVATTTHSSLARYGIPNHVLNCFIVLEIGCSLMAIYIPELQRPFGLQALNQEQLLIGATPLFAIVLIDEVRKFFVRQREASLASLAKAMKRNSRRLSKSSLPSLPKHDGQLQP